MASVLENQNTGESGEADSIEIDSNTEVPSATIQASSIVRHERHYEFLKHNEDGLLLGTSSLTGQYWGGSLFYYAMNDTAFDIQSYTAASRTYSSACDAAWINNNKFCTGSDTGSLEVWHIESNESKCLERLYDVCEHDDMLVSVSVTCHKHNVVTGSYDKGIKIWSIEDQHSTDTFRAHSDHVLQVCCHPSEEDVFLSCSKDGKILMWDTRKPKPAVIIDKSPLAHSPTCIAWRPGSIYTFAAGDEAGNLIVKDTRQSTSMGELLSTVGPLNNHTHTRRIHRISFSHDTSNYLASVGDDCRVVIYSLDDSAIRKIYEDKSHMDLVHGLSWKPKASCLYTCSWDSTVKYHEVTMP